MALNMLLVKVALSDIGFVLGVTEAPVLAWRRRAAQQAHESIPTCCGTCPSPRGNAMRGGTASGAHMPSKPARTVKAAN